MALNMHITGKRRLFSCNENLSGREVGLMKAVACNVTSAHNYSQPDHNKKHSRKNKCKRLQRSSDKHSIASLARRS
jgi:hypothetical protein